MKEKSNKKLKIAEVEVYIGWRDNDDDGESGARMQNSMQGKPSDAAPKIHHPPPSLLTARVAFACLHRQRMMNSLSLKSALHSLFEYFVYSFFSVSAD